MSDNHTELLDKEYAQTLIGKCTVYKGYPVKVIGYGDLFVHVELLVYQGNHPQIMMAHPEELEIWIEK